MINLKNFNNNYYYLTIKSVVKLEIQSFSDSTFFTFI